MMRFQLDVTLTESDYLAFNYFHTLESASGKKQIQKSRIIFLAVIAVLSVLFILVMGWTLFSIIYVILLGLFTAIYMLFFKKILKRNLKSQIKMLKKNGKLPFDSVSSFEFYEDKLVETTATSRIEQHYCALERICIVENRFLYLYHSSVGAFILPISQIKEQVDQKEFEGFITQKCNTVEYYPQSK